MKRGGYYRNSRSKSHDRHKSRRSRDEDPSRSRDKDHKKNSNNNSLRMGPAKTQSDIHNHFRLRISNVNTKEQQQIIGKLKGKLNEQIGPVQHITRSRESSYLNLGFKYDIDALSFMQTGGLTVRTDNKKIQIDPEPTQIFQFLVKNNYGDVNGKESQKRNDNKKKSRHKKSKSKSYSSSSSSKGRHSYDEKPKNKSKKDKEREKDKDKEKEKQMKLQIYGIPSNLSEQRTEQVLSHAPGGPYKFSKFAWRTVNNSVCEYLQVRLQVQKANKLLSNSKKIQLHGRPIIILEEGPNASSQLQKYHVWMQFPEAVQPGRVVKNIQSIAKVVQIVAAEQIQQGKSRAYIVTLNDSSAANSFRRLGRLHNGVTAGAPKQNLNVYRSVVKV